VQKSMSMGRRKCTNIINNVLCPTENEYLVKNLQTTKFSVFIDETSDTCNEKWMTFFDRYVDSDMQDIRSQLLKLINIDTTDCSAEKLFNAFKTEMWKLQIPFQNIVALSCDNASVMIGKHLSFQTKLKEMCKQLLIFPCPCHSSALAAHAACAKIPSYCDEFFKKIVSYINSSPQRTAIFHEFCDCFQEKYRKIVRLSDTRWLSHYICVERLLQSWCTIRHFLQEMVVSEKCKSAIHLLSTIDNVELKAYFLFLKYVLYWVIKWRFYICKVSYLMTQYFFNAFNTFFQSTETRVHLLQLKSSTFLLQMCRNFLKKDYLKDVATNINFAQKENQKDINDILVGSECEKYLDNLILEDHIDAVTQVRQHCLQFYVTAAEEIRKRLPVNDVLKKLQVFIPSTAVFDSNRNTSFQHVSFIAKTIGGFDEESLKN
ncbi:SCAN domain-containing protein, partial [Ooceraea biroi]